MGYKVLKTRSPFFHQVAATTGAACSLEIRVWNDDSKPTNADITLEANSIDGYATFEVSDVVRGLITDDLRFGSSGVYFVELKGYEGATLESTVKMLATEGYALSSEGLRVENSESELIGTTNPESGTRESRILISEGEESQVVQLIDADTTPTGNTRYRLNYKSGSNGSWVSYSTTTEQASDTMIEVTLDSTVESLQHQVSGVNHYVYVDTLQCNYFDKYKLSYVNKNGFKNEIWFNGRTDSKISTSKDSFKTSNVNYSFNMSESISVANNFNNYHNSFDRVSDSRKSYTLNSDFIDEYYVQQFEELFLSENVWISTSEDEYIPVNIKESRFDVKNHKNDRLISYTIRVEEANSYINQYR